MEKIEIIEEKIKLGKQTKKPLSDKQKEHLIKMREIKNEKYKNMKVEANEQKYKNVNGLKTKLKNLDKLDSIFLKISDLEQTIKTKNLNIKDEIQVEIYKEPEKKELPKEEENLKEIEIKTEDKPLIIDNKKFEIIKPTMTPMIGSIQQKPKKKDIRFMNPFLL